MGQKPAKIRYGEDKIIRIEDGYTPKTFPGGIGTTFFNYMRKYKDNVAQIDALTGETQTYAALLQLSIRTALEMRAKGIKPNDVISICSHNHMDTVIPLYATFFIGAIPASLDPTLSLTDTTHLIKQVKPKMFFVSENASKLIGDALKLAKLEAEVVVFGETEKFSKFSEFVVEKKGERDFKPEENVDEMDTAIIFFSSGTTGLPKGICLTHFAILVLDFRVTLVYSSLYWISALGMIISATFTGGARLIDAEFEAQKTWSNLEKYKVTLCFLTVNASMDLYRMGRPFGIDTSALKAFITGGEKVSSATMNGLREVFPGTIVSQGYGQTELVFLTCFDLNSPVELEMTLRKPQSCGRPVATIDCYKVVDIETGQPLGFNQHGELCVKGKFFMKGYYNLDSSGVYDEDGYVKTGDIVYYDEEFCFFVVDCIKEMLKYRSWHVAPATLEEILLTHPVVKAAVVVGVPDKEDGEHPMACVILKPGAKRVLGEEIRRYVDERVDDRKKLRGGVVFVKSFPTTPSGKISRRFLKDLRHQAR